MFAKLREKLEEKTADYAHDDAAKLVFKTAAAGGEVAIEDLWLNSMKLCENITRIRYNKRIYYTIISIIM